MAKKSISPNRETAKLRLDELWKEISKEKNGKIDAEINTLITSSQVGIRFCIFTQLLGKYTDGNLDCLCLQKGKGEDDSSWDPRGFASKVVVPWVAENQSVLGTSADPYVGKPLRKKRLEASPEAVKGEEEWSLLYNVLNDVEKKNNPEFTKIRMLQTLRSIHRSLSNLTFEYNIPERISLQQTDTLVEKYLSESSGGDRGLSVAAGLFETFGKFFQIYSEVKRNVINASDKSTGLAGDIECIDEKGVLKLAIEVKERDLTLTDVRSAIAKARRASAREVLLNTPGSTENEKIQIEDLISRTWASGTNIYQFTIHDLIVVGLFLTGENGRIDFVKNVGDQLNRYNTQPNNRKRWKELLEEI